MLLYPFSTVAVAFRLLQIPGSYLTNQFLNQICGLRYKVGISSSVADPHNLDADPDPAFHFDADPDPAFPYDADPDPACHVGADPDPIFHIDADPDPDPSFQIKAQNLEKFLDRHIPVLHKSWRVR
jgi:hypothetical protein